MLSLKWEDLSRFSTKLHVCKKTATCTGLQAEQIFSVNIFGRGFCGSFPMLFPKALVSCCKNFFELMNCCMVLLYLWAQKRCLWFLKSYFKLEISTFLYFMVSFLLDMFNQKAPYLTKKTWAMKSDTHFSREAIAN